MTVNAQVQAMCIKEGQGLLTYGWAFQEEKQMYTRDEMHLLI